MAREMTLKQRKFVELYEGNATEAARKAGFKNPDVIGSRLVRKSCISEAIKKRQDKKIKPSIASREERAELYTSLLRKSEDENIKIKAAETLGKMEGDFITRVDVTGKVEHIVLIDSEQSYEDWKKEQNGRV